MTNNIIKYAVPLTQRTEKNSIQHIKIRKTESNKIYIYYNIYLEHKYKIHFRSSTKLIHKNKTHKRINLKNKLILSMNPE